MFWDRANGRSTPSGRATPSRRTSTPAMFTQNTFGSKTSYGMNSNSAAYKLYYFSVRNTAEPSRMILNYAGVPFEDIRIAPDAWPNWKAKMPQQTVPVLMVENKRLSQSMAIVSFLGRRFGLAGRNDWEQARVDEAILTYKDFYGDIRNYLYVVSGFEQGNTKELMESTVKPAADKYLPLFSHMLDRHNNQFIAGNRETYADFVVSDFLYSLNGMASKLFDRYPDLKEYIKRVQNLPQLQQYIKSRPKTVL